MTVTRSIWGLTAVVVVACAIVAAVALTPRTAVARGVPTASVARGALRLDVYATGELRAGRSASLSAPPAGGRLRLLQLVETGMAVRAGDTVAEFDPADQQYLLDQAQSGLAEAEEEITKMKADLAVQAAQDQVDLLTARFDVRRAELDARSPERLIGANDAKKRRLAVEEAQRRLAQLEDDLQSRVTTSRAALAVVDEKRTKARLAAERAQQIIGSLVLRSPLDGLVVVKENRDAAGGMFFSGMSLPELKAGDSMYSGQVVLEVYSAVGMEVRVKVSEQERANVVAGQTVTVRADVLPGRTFRGRVLTLAGLASRGGFFESAGPLRQFDVTVALDEPESRLRAGTSVRALIAGTEIKDALTVPRQALFEKNGKPVVYVRAGELFTPREVKVTHRTESRVALDGIAEGTEVALVNPDKAGPGTAAGATASGGPVAGGPR
jgi:multidrug efflux pump subunit AcrA (membrane-fusion protein)